MILFSETVRQRRALLKRRFDITGIFERLEESCVPSYAHSNKLAAWVAWRRLSIAAALYRRHAPAGPILDFGASTGEIYHLIQPRGDYCFVEANDLLAESLLTDITSAQRLMTETLKDQEFAAIFALDSLEHNRDFDSLVTLLSDRLSGDGVFILSGPTENVLYRFGRRLAGFSGHYHYVTIFDIEEFARRRMRSVQIVPLPLGMPLFRISVWRRA